MRNEILYCDEKQAQPRQGPRQSTETPCLRQDYGCKDTLQPEVKWEERIYLAYASTSLSSLKKVRTGAQIGPPRGVDPIEE